MTSANKPPIHPDIDVLIDLDGVLADFALHAQNHGKIDDQDKVKWNELDHDWWASMPAFDGAKKFYDDLATMTNTSFLTTPSMGVECFSGKAAWLKSFVPERSWSILKDLIICSKKHLLATPSRILIDDRERNVAEWQAAGGIGILHTGDFAETMRRVQDAIAQIHARNTPAATSKDPQP
jgi:5'(3')-deoxyribonucleotidase